MDDDDLESLEIRAVHFLRDRGMSTLTGIRRMGRDRLVDLVSDICDREGIPCSVFPDTSSSEIVLFRGWEGTGEIMESMLSENPDIDILYGQEICHQVPAIVRYSKVKKKGI